jgi:S1-C subfamily serine protease
MMKNGQLNRAEGCFSGFRHAGANRWELVIAAVCVALLCLSHGWAIPASPAEPDIRKDATVAAVEKVLPSVVNIATATIVQYEDFYSRAFRDFFGYRGPTSRSEEKLNSIGSGVIIDEDGYVLTNLHVVRRATRTQVKLWDGREYDADPIVGTENSDVALLKLRAKPGEKFKAIKLAKDDDLLLGETVLALGDPFGLGGTVTKGILSSKTRRPPTGDEPLDINDWLQTDAAINPGNSGGPLVNLRGELIGLNVAVFREGQGIGFAIPIKQVSEALSGFFSPEFTYSLWFGAHFKADSSPLLVTAIQNGGPAEKGGLRAGDRILKVNGKAPDGLIDFNQTVGESTEHKITLQVAREKETREISIRLVPFDELIQQKLGCTLQELTQQEATRRGLRGTKGLLIGKIEKDSPAERAQLQEGFILTEVDGHASADLVSFANVITSKKKGEPAKVAVIVPRRIGGNYVEYRSGTVDVQLR